MIRVLKGELKMDKKRREHIKNLIDECHAGKIAFEREYKEVMEEFKND